MSNNCARILYPYASAINTRVDYKSTTLKLGAFVASLEHLYRAMQFAEKLAQQAEREHWANFQLQIRERLGIAHLQFEAEPYLEPEMLKAQLAFVERIETLFNQIERLMQDNTTPQKARFDVQASLLPQVERQVATETLLMRRQLHRALDKRRQRNAGVTHYIWMTQQDDRVRPSHRAMSGQLVAWAGEPATGHAGVSFGCRCYGIPTGIDMDEGDDASDEFEEFDVAVLGGIRIIIQQILKRTGDRVVKLPKPKPKTPPKPTEKPKTKPISKDKATSHGRERGQLRNISEKDVEKAIKSAEKSGRVTTKRGKYGTLQKHYEGNNGITVVIETEGRNAGKVVTVWRR